MCDDHLALPTRKVLDVLSDKFLTVAMVAERAGLQGPNRIAVAERACEALKRLGLAERSCILGFWQWRRAPPGGQKAMT